MTESTPAERVLVVDDEQDIVALVTYHLLKSGYRVSTARSGTGVRHLLHPPGFETERAIAIGRQVADEVFGRLGRREF